MDDSTMRQELSKVRQDAAGLRQQLFSASQRNEQLSTALKAARAELDRLKTEAERIAEPPNSYAVVLGTVREGDVVFADVHYAGRPMRLSVSTEVPLRDLTPGRRVRLTEGLVIVEALGFVDEGSVVTVRELIDDTRVLAATSTDEERVVILAQPLRDKPVRVGDSLVFDSRSGLVVERLERAETASLMLETVPDISYSDIGGLSAQISEIRDAVELPFEHPQLYTEHGLKPPKGILLYGPPGNGKTLIAKAVANSLAQRRGGESTRSYFLNIKGPELLDKYVGETERQLRTIFARAREKATAGSPVVVFFDEMEALFRTRGTGKSSDVETTIVPQLLTEIDGVEQLDNVIVIGASNREDLIDPAILRPGRLDVKIRIERPDREGAKDIFSKYLTEDLPIAESEITTTKAAAVESLIERCVEEMYAETDRNRFVEVTYANGRREMLYFAEFTSGAMISNVVDRAKKHAIKAYLDLGEHGITWDHLYRGIREEFSEHEDLPNTTNPDEWARISGKKGERITHLVLAADVAERESRADSGAGSGTSSVQTARGDSSLI